MIAPDFLRQRVPATESIAVVLVEGQIVRTDDLHGDSRPQGCAQGWAQVGAMNTCPLAQKRQARAHQAQSVMAG